MVQPLIAGNWKMYKTPSEAEAWAKKLLGRSLPTDKAELAVCAPFTHLAHLARVLAGSPVALGAQDVSQHEEGAYTGEISAAMLQDLGVHYVIVGHSERRQYHGESDELISAKLKRALAYGLAPILCIGERLDEREAKRTMKVVLGQLERALEGVSLENPADLVIAYEPVWAIGTGRTASAEDAQEVSGAIRERLKARYPEHAERMRILYGGSMKPENAAELLAQRDINGGLIGGASLEIDSFLKIASA
jgi:triosephosphate isomerase (TIM)